MSEPIPSIESLRTACEAIMRKLEAVTVERDRLQAENAELQKRCVKPDSYTGWMIVQECDDGSLLLESHTGARRHIWMFDKEVERLQDLCLYASQVITNNRCLLLPLDRAHELAEAANASRKRREEKDRGNEPEGTE